MSLVANQGNPFEFIAYVNYGANQNAVRYDMSNLSLNLWNYEPIWGAVITHTTEATPPPALYLYESFYWQASSHGPVQWTPIVQQPNCDPLPTPNSAVPEPSALSVTLLAFLVLIVIRFACRPKWGDE